MRRRDEHLATPSRKRKLNFSHTITSGNAALHADIIGSGIPVVFLHAAVADTRMWSAQLAGVSINNKAVAYDRRGFGKTRYEREDFSSVADLLAVIDAIGDGGPAILVGCSQGGRIALDAALQHPSRVRGLVLVAPNVPGAPEPDKLPEIERLLKLQNEAIESRDVDRVNAIKAHLWLDGPLMPEGRVSGSARQLLTDMNSIVLRSPPTGTDVDVANSPSAFHRLDELTIPTLMMWGDLDFPHIQERCRVAVEKMENGSSQILAGTAHLPSLDQPDVVTNSLLEFIDHYGARG